MTKRLWLISVAALVLLAGCGESDSPKEWSRMPGETPPAATPMPAMAAVPGHVHTGGAMPGPASASGPMGIPEPPQANVRATSGSLLAAGVGFMIPEGWDAGTPGSRMRLAQYALPGSGGDAEMAVFYFGPGQGGTPKANIDRWVAQFTADADTTSSVPVDVAEMEAGGLRLYFVKASGTYTATAMGPMAPPQPPKPEHALFGLVVEGGPQGSLFIKATGPKSTMEEQSSNLEMFAKSTKRISP